MSGDECPICLERPASVYLQPCAHGFCATCLEKAYVQYKARTCALCRTTIIASTTTPIVRRSPHFDRHTFVVCTSCIPAGVTLTKRHNKRTIEVSALESDGAARVSGMHTNDTLLTINGLRCHDTAHAADIFTTAHDWHRDVICSVARRPPGCCDRIGDFLFGRSV
jgi:hypothetical protein